MAKTNKGRKFFATTATAALVASAIVPVASAAQINDYNSISPYAQEAVQDLVDRDIIQGDEKGNFNPKKTVTRAEAATILTKALELSSTSTVNFTDVAVGAWYYEAIAAVVNAGIFEGQGAGKFNPSGNLTRSEAAIILVEAFNLEGSSSLAQFKDSASVKTWAQEALEIAVANGVLLGDDKGNLNPNAPIVRQDFALMFGRTEAAAENPVVAELAIESVKATTAKTITVAFNTAVEDTTKATFEVLRGAFKQTVTAKWAEDKKSVELVSANNFQTGDYTVNVSGLTEKVLTGSVKFEAQKVASIEILSDVAVVGANPASGLLTSNDTATVGYVVKDQYGTDITSTTGLTTNDTTVNANRGTLTVSGTALVGKRLGDLVPVVLIHQATGVTATKTLKLSAAATIAKVEGTGVVNAKGEAVALTDATKANSVFLTLKLTDQYGNVLNAATASAALRDSLLVANQNPLVANASTTVDTAIINGKTEFVVKFNKVDANTEFRGGTADILFISKANGEKFTYTVTVNETAATDSVTIGQPEYAVAGEAIKFPITVTDKAGNLITDVKVLTNTAKGIKANNASVAATNFEVKDGQVFFIIPASQNTTTGFKTLILTTSTYKVGTLTYEVQAAAKPTAIRGFKSGVIKTGVTKDLEWKDLNVEDQYGRVMTTASLSTGDSAAFNFQVVDVNGSTITKTGAKQIKAGSNNGTSTVQLELLKDGVAVANTAVNLALRVTDGKEYDSFEISLASDKVKATSSTTDAAELTVNGILAGGKVALDSNEYTASVVGVGAVTNGEIIVPVANLDVKDTQPQDTEFTLRVVLNATGEVLEKKITVSAKAASAQDLFFTTGTVYATATPIASANLFVTGDTAKTVATNLVAGNAELAVNYAIVDQYGTESFADAVTSITIVPEKLSDVTITNNGTANAAVALASGVTSSVVTIKVTIGSVTKELKVTVEKR